FAHTPIVSGRRISRRAGKPAAHDERRALTFLAVQHVADGLTPFGIHFAFDPALDLILMTFAPGLLRFGLAALRAAVGKAGLVRPQFEFFSAHYARFDRERH